MQIVFMSRSALNGRRGCFSFGFLKFEKKKNKTKNEKKNGKKLIKCQNRIFASQGIKMKLHEMKTVRQNVLRLKRQLFA